MTKPSDKSGTSDNEKAQSSESKLITLSGQQPAPTTSLHQILPSTAAHTIPHLALNASQDHQSQSTGQSSNTNNDIFKPRHARLQTQIQNLTLQIQETRSKLTATLSELQNISPSPTTTTATAMDTRTPTDIDVPMLQHARAIVKEHMRLLHTYNAIKDIGLGLMGLIADKDGRRLAEVMDEFDVDEKD